MNTQADTGSRPTASASAASNTSNSSASSDILKSSSTDSSNLASQNIKPSSSPGIEPSATKSLPQTSKISSLHNTSATTINSPVVLAGTDTSVVSSSRPQNSSAVLTASLENSSPTLKHSLQLSNCLSITRSPADTLSLTTSTNINSSKSIMMHSIKILDPEITSASDLSLHPPIVSINASLDSKNNPINSRDSSSRFFNNQASFSIKRRFRSKSLPNINFARRNRHRHYQQSSSTFYKQQNKHISLLKKKTSLNRSHHHHHRGPLHLRNSGANLSCSIPASSSTSNSNNNDLPPVNIQSLKEIDLSEIVKNPQLRHDILFDPQLQFRPNLDGERGKRKKIIVDKYWKDIQLECNNYFQLSGNKKSLPSNSSSSFDIFDNNNNSKNNTSLGSKLPKLFHTLRDILLTLLQPEEKATVFEIMDIDLLLQQLRKGVVDFVSLSNWLASVFKANCAPMRDFWVDEMQQKFVEAHGENSISKLVEGLRLVFNILEAMKLDVANHQIRVYRPILVENAVEFERDYFNQMINVHKLNITDSLTWYVNSSKKQIAKDSQANRYKVLIPDKLQRDAFFEKSPIYLRNVLITSIIQLLSCREMTTEFPSTLCFDHSRLILFRADVRQLVCLQICLYLYKQLVSIYNPKMKFALHGKSALLDTKSEILALITDDNGNVKWTRNIPSIAVQLAKRATASASSSLASSSLTNHSSSAPPPEAVVTFAHSWLLKQTQPKSDVYKLMEERTFAQLRSLIISVLESCSIVNNSSNNNGIINSSPSTSSSNGGTPSPGRRSRKLMNKKNIESDNEDESDSDHNDSNVVTKKRKISSTTASSVINNDSSFSSSNNHNNLFGVMSSLTSIDGIPSRTNSPSTDSSANVVGSNKPILSASASTSSLLNSVMSKDKQAGSSSSASSSSANNSSPSSGMGTNGGTVGEEISALANKMAVLCNFNWCVLGNHYINAVKESNSKSKA